MTKDEYIDCLSENKMLEMLYKLQARIVFNGKIEDTNMFAAVQTATVVVTANVVNNCTISANPVAFGTYDPLAANAATGADLFANGSVVVTCTKGASGVWIDLNAGGHAGVVGGVSRAMAIGATTNYLGYELYKTDPSGGGGTVWGVGDPGAGGAGVAHASGTALAPTSYTVFGRVPKGQDPTAGAYTDSVTATINY
jgi:spore coat protein U-like protein